MPIEYEAKVLDIDPEAVAAKILALGGEHTGDALMRRHVYDITPGDDSKWLRLRDTGTAVTLTVKEITHDGIDGTSETEITVDDFDTTAVLLTKLGYTPKSYQENNRSSYLLDGVQLEIDTWPLIPAYLEIEAASAAEVHTTAARLGYTPDDLTSINTTKVYAHYGIDLTTINELTFPPRPH